MIFSRESKEQSLLAADSPHGCVRVFCCLGGGVVGTEVPCSDWRQGWRGCRVKKMGVCLHDAGCRVKFSGFCLHDAANFSGD